MLRVGTTLICFLCAGFVAAELRCQSADGQTVDYWTGVKFPNPAGTRYTYTDDTLTQDSWTLGDDLAAQSGSNPLASTLGPLYANADYGYVLWNDEHPSTSGSATSSTKAHAKGVLAFGPDGGFWLVHSVPKFPDNPSASEYTGILSGQQINAQSFLCLSLTPSVIEQVAALLDTEDLYFYSTVGDIPASLQGQYPVATGMVSVKPSGAARETTKALQTEGGEPFVAFATSSTDIGGGSRAQQDLYEDLIENYFGSSLETSTWPDESDFDASDCPDSGYYTENVKGVSVKEAGLGWKNTQDHSKWCVTAMLAPADSTQVKVACVGDKNRDDAQLLRGGGAVCFASNANIWQLYTSLIDLVEGC